ncbi:MAG: methionine--tRNA ligase [Oceanococcaceae bacterium]
MRRILLTSALPYANAPLHLGHILEVVQADVLARAWRLAGHTVHYICANDAHGTPIMLHAEKQGIPPEALVAQVGAEHRRDYADFGIAFDNFHTTHSPENKAALDRIFTALQAEGHIEAREIQQAWDPIKGMFLPDRYIRGTCPRCGAEDQYGDACEKCGATYDPLDLLNPRSALTGAAPEQKPSTHYFFKLGHFETFLQNWLQQADLQPAVRAKLAEWFDAGLKDWDISRDAPYFGFEIPGAPGKFFYVWVDAPMGYIASWMDWLGRMQPDVDPWAAWLPDSDTDIVHIIGKDITYFHALFWPAMLQGAGLKPPSAIHAHGFLTINGEKMSKSRGTFITARRYLEHLPAEYLRYYFAAKLANGVDDMDLNLEDFKLRINADLIGKYVNIAARCSGFVQKLGDGRLADELDSPALVAELASAGDAILASYTRRDTGQAIRQIMQLADRANAYVAERAPWALAKDPGTVDQVLPVCTTALNLFRLLSLYLSPVLPETTGRVAEWLHGLPAWDERSDPLVGIAIAPYRNLLQRVDETALAALA